MAENQMKKDVKIGARILALEELGKLLPNYNNIFDQIREIKEVAQEYNQMAKQTIGSSYDLQREREFNKHFDNIFSILGERGSGKTSVMLTLKYMLIEGYERDKNTRIPANKTDMFMPVIVPEDMEPSSDILGWLIGYLNDIVLKIEQEIKRNESRLYDDRQYYEYFERCGKKTVNPLRESYMELQRAYQIRTAEYKSILRENYVGTNEYVEDSSRVTEFDQQLMSKFQKFWQELLDVKRSINNSKEPLADERRYTDIDADPDKEPLLFIFFDDVDICTERCYEILNTTMRYLAYPNIVVFISGNYKTFSEVLTINFLKKDSLLGDQMDKKYGYSDGVSAEYRKTDDSAIENRKKLAQDYLLKVLPPALRYYMPHYTDRMKADFTYTNVKAYFKRDRNDNSTENKLKHETLYELLVKNFIDSSGNDKGDENFLMYKYKKKEKNPQTNKEVEIEYTETLYPFFKIFPDSPRGLMNIYYFLYNKLTITYIKEKWNSNNLNQFLNIIVNSSNLLSKYKNEIYRIIDMRDENLEKKELLFIDYKYLLSVFEALKSEEEYKNKRNILIEDFITIFMLAYFFENILNLVYGKREDTNGYKTLIKILNSIESDFIVYPKIENISLLLRIYELISKQNSEAILISKNKDHFLMKYFELIEQYVVKMNDSIHDFFERMYKLDEKWTNEKLDLIMKLGGRQNKALRLEMENTFEKLMRIRFEQDFLNDCKKEIESELLKLSEADVNVKREILIDLNRELNEKINEQLKKYDLDKLEQLYYYTNMLYSKQSVDNNKQTKTVNSKRSNPNDKSNNNKTDNENLDRYKEMLAYKTSIDTIINTNDYLKKEEGKENEVQIKDELKSDYEESLEKLITSLNIKMLYKELNDKLRNGINFDYEIDREKDIQSQKEKAKEKATKNATILTIEEEMEIEDSIGKKLSIEDELKKVVEVYEKTFDELKQIMGTRDIVIADSGDFQKLLEKIIELGTEEIGRTANTIKDKLENDGKIYKKELDSYLDIVSKYSDIELSKNIDTGKKEKANSLDYYLKSIRALPITYESNDAYREFYYRVAKDKFIKEVLLNYIRVNTLLEINKRNESPTHTSLRRLKHDLVDYPIINRKTPSYFDIYIKYKEKNSLKVYLNV